MGKKFFIKILTIISMILILSIVSIYYIDPFFYFHKPLKNLNYNINYYSYNTFKENVKLTGTYQRYSNYRLSQIFPQKGIIIGTSMVENFKVSLFKENFGIEAIKLPYSGATFYDINKELKKILEKKNNIEIVLRGLDYNKIREDYLKSSGAYIPSYLYENKKYNINIFKYFFDIKAIKRIINIIENTIRSSNKEFDFNEYSNWNDAIKFGKEVVLNGQNSVLVKYERKKQKIKELNLTIEEKIEIEKNIKENIIEVPKIYPNIKFIYFITPYSIVYWDDLNQKGEIEKQILAEKYMIEKILEIPNIELYSFFNNYEMITNLDNYRDAGHYMGNINDQILFWIKNKEYRLTKENYQEYINKNLEFYKYYDYNKIFKKSAENL